MYRSVKYRDTPPQVVVSKINKVVKELLEAGLRQTVNLRWEAVPDAVPDQPMPPISKKINIIMIINDIY